MSTTTIPKTTNLKTKKRKADQPAPAFEVQDWKEDGVVGTCDAISQKQLATVLEHLANPQSAYFLRWPHRVSGWHSKLPKEFPSPEGQLVTAEIELRWRRYGHGYDLLLLSAESVKWVADQLPELKRLGTWQTCLRPVLPYRDRIPQYPKRFQYEGINPDQLQQRYFRNAQTGIVQFVALALVKGATVPDASSDQLETNQNG